MTKWQKIFVENLEKKNNEKWKIIKYNADKSIVAAKL